MPLNKLPPPKDKALDASVMDKMIRNAPKKKSETEEEKKEKRLAANHEHPADEQWLHPENDALFEGDLEE